MTPTWFCTGGKLWTLISLDPISSTQPMNDDEVPENISSPEIVQNVSETEPKMKPQKLSGAVLMSDKGGSNILSLLLEKGEKLRNEMVKSHLETKVDQ